MLMSTLGWHVEIHSYSTGFNLYAIAPFSDSAEVMVEIKIGVKNCGVESVEKIDIRCPEFRRSVPVSNLFWNADNLYEEGDFLVYYFLDFLKSISRILL